MSSISKFYRFVYEKDIYYFIRELVGSFAFVMWLGFTPSYPQPLRNVSYTVIALFIISQLMKLIKVFANRVPSQTEGTYNKREDEEDYC